MIVVRHPDMHQVLAFERSDHPGSWQLPQGGIELGEEPIDTAWRELGEETGLGEEQVVARAEYPEWVAYEWPIEVLAARGDSGRRLGQVQRWFLFDARSAEIQPVPDGSEFIAWKWVDPQWLTAEVAEWRRAAYHRVLDSL